MMNEMIPMINFLPMSVSVSVRLLEAAMAGWIQSGEVRAGRSPWSWTHIKITVRGRITDALDRTAEVAVSVQEGLGDLVVHPEDMAEDHVVAWTPCAALIIVQLLLAGLAVQDDALKYSFEQEKTSLNPNKLDYLLS